MTSYQPTQIKEIEQLVDQWLKIDVNPQSRNEILDLQKNKKYHILDEKLSKRIAFGTAGLRSSMESGFSHMNDVTILQASQGLVKYLLRESKQPSIVIGYDHRFHSQRYAEITASVALSQGLTVYYLGTGTNLSDESITTSETKLTDHDKLYKDRLYVHTPLVPFSIDQLHASAGVMVTASHNPAKDNGYKVYYGNGCQIIPPHDNGIATSIENNLDPWLVDNVWDIVCNFKKGLKDGKLIEVKEKITEAYVKQVKKKLIADNEVSFLFVYTPMHGIGREIFDKIMKEFIFTEGAKVIIAKEQSEPDPKFTTVKFPNPEEKGALDLAINKAESLGLNLVVATDPDADRFSVAIKAKQNDTWRQLTGNEIGFLFAMYVIEELTSQDQLPKTYLLNSTVSSQILASMAEYHGFNFKDTLTGFKWIGNKAVDLKKEGYHVPFGYEEAIGFMFDVVNDKDGISAVSIWLQLYEKWFSKGENVVDKLEEGYRKYGWFKECNGYYKLNNLSKTAEIFEHGVRGSFSGRNYPDKIGPLKVVAWRDLTIGYDSSTKDNVPSLPIDALSQMITGIVQLEDSKLDEVARFTCRGSGTEPKLKVYIEGKSNSSEEQATKLARLCWNTLRDEWFKPHENDLEEVV